MEFTPDDVADWMLKDRKDTFAYDGHKVYPGFKPFDRLMIEVQHQNIDFDIRNTKFQKLVESVIGKCPESVQEWGKLITESSQTHDLRSYLKKQLNEDMSNGVIITMQDGRKLQYSDILDIGTGHIYAAVGKIGEYTRRNRPKWARGGKWYLGKKSFNLGDRHVSRHKTKFYKPSFHYVLKYNMVHTINKHNILGIAPVGQDPNPSDLNTDNEKAYDSEVDRLYLNKQDNKLDPGGADDGDGSGHERMAGV